MTAPSTVRAVLRTATAAHHERVDAIFSQADLTTREGYCRFLLAQAAAFLPVEAALERDGAATLLADWATRRRAPLLMADLAMLDLPVPEAPVEIAFDSPAALLGGIYVLEGSRLGGAMLARDVPADMPRRFLAPGDSGRWRRLLETIEHVLTSADHIASAIESASCVFLLFEGSGRRYLRADSVGRI